ncbi:MAG TPA: hypothetical protein VMN58_01870 [Acidimicrobiales bacterium]|nr:hypothetical protein [Acidimicrobiales bacterium]
MADATSPVASQAKLLAGYRALAGLFAVLVLVQAWMAGRSDVLFGDIDIVLHGVVGNVSYLVAVGALVVAIVARADKVAIGVSAVLVVAVTAQIGLGYTGRTTLAAAAWHIPLGVAIFGLAVFQLSQALSLGRGSAR